MHNALLSRRGHGQSAFLEDLQHRGIFRQDLGNQLLQPGLTGKRNQMAHQRRTDTLALILIDHAESDLGPPGRDDDVTPARNDRRSSFFFRHCDQGYVTDEIDVQEERDFRLGEAASYREEAPVKGLCAAAADGFTKSSLVLGSERADFDAAAIAQCLDRRIPGASLMGRAAGIPSGFDLSFVRVAVAFPALNAHRERI